MRDFHFNSFDMPKLNQFVFTVAVALLAMSSCQVTPEKLHPEDFQISITGEAQGTTYSIVYYDLQERNLKPQIDSILTAIDKSVSTYLKGSVIDVWNQSETGGDIDMLFYELLMESWEMYKLTNGAFDPTVKPLVSYWGFGPEKYVHPEVANEQMIDSLIALIGFDSLRIGLNNELPVRMEEFEPSNYKKGSLQLYKPVPGMQLDFNAIGQGWSVDKIALFLEKHDISIYFVELGGEIRAGYPKPEGKLWRFGVDKPVAMDEERELESIISLRNKGLATSGSYRKFYERDGARFSHTIDPLTGFPVKHEMLSATVVASTAGDADALATAFMVMGPDSTVKFLNRKNYLETYVHLIMADSAPNTFKTYTSPQLEKMMETVADTLSAN